MNLLEPRATRGVKTLYQHIRYDYTLKKLDEGCINKQEHAFCNLQ